MGSVYSSNHKSPSAKPVAIYKTHGSCNSKSTEIRNRQYRNRNLSVSDVLLDLDLGKKQKFEHQQNRLSRVHDISQSIYTDGDSSRVTSNSNSVFPLHLKQLRKNSKEKAKSLDANLLTQQSYVGQPQIQSPKQPNLEQQQMLRAAVRNLQAQQSREQKLKQKLLNNERAIRQRQQSCNSAINKQDNQQQKSTDQHQVNSPMQTQTVGNCASGSKLTGKQGVSTNKKVKNLVTVYNEQTYEIIKVRVNRVMTLGQFKQRVADYFNCHSSNLRLKIGPQVFQSSTKLEDSFKLFGPQLRVTDDALIKVERKDVSSRANYRSNENNKDVCDKVDVNLLGKHKHVSLVSSASKVRLSNLENKNNVVVKVNKRKNRVQKTQDSSHTLPYQSFQDNNETGLLVMPTSPNHNTRTLNFSLENSYVQQNQSQNQESKPQCRVQNKKRRSRGEPVFSLQQILSPEQKRVNATIGGEYQSGCMMPFKTQNDTANSSFNSKQQSQGSNTQAGINNQFNKHQLSNKLALLSEDEERQPAQNLTTSHASYSLIKPDQTSFVAQPNNKDQGQGYPSDQKVNIIKDQPVCLLQHKAPKLKWSVQESNTGHTPVYHNKLRHQNKASGTLEQKKSRLQKEKGAITSFSSYNMNIPLKNSINSQSALRSNTGMDQQSCGDIKLSVGRSETKQTSLILLNKQVTHNSDHQASLTRVIVSSKHLRPGLCSPTNSTEGGVQLFNSGEQELPQQNIGCYTDSALSITKQGAPLYHCSNQQIKDNIKTFQQFKYKTATSDGHCQIKDNKPIDNQMSTRLSQSTQKNNQSAAEMAKRVHAVRVIQPAAVEAASGQTSQRVTEPTLEAPRAQIHNSAHKSALKCFEQSKRVMPWHSGCLKPQFFGRVPIVAKQIADNDEIECEISSRSKSSCCFTASTPCSVNEHPSTTKVVVPSQHLIVVRASQHLKDQLRHTIQFKCKYNQKNQQ